MKYLSAIVIAAALLLPTAAFANAQARQSPQAIMATLLPTGGQQGEQGSLIKKRTLKERRPKTQELQPNEITVATKAL
jgi:hypothetical protein